MRLTLLGTGDAGGMPLFGCHCPRCATARTDPALRRRSASALLSVADRHYLIDAGLTDIEERFGDSDLHAILLTHFHVDHVQGLFHIRWGRGDGIPVYCPNDTNGCADLFKHPGVLQFNRLHKYESFYLDDLKITPLPLIHSRPTLGYVFEHERQRIAYLVDTRGLPPKVEDFLASEPLDLLVIDTSFPPGVDNTNHNNLDDTLALQQRIGASRTVMTHIGHDLDTWLSDDNNHLPDTLLAGHDGGIVFP
jgi:phosphoribosyl 1,2-cyclic phosphate phosphodiesterase